MFTAVFNVIIKSCVVGRLCSASVVMMTMVTVAVVVLVSWRAAVTSTMLAGSSVMSGRRPAPVTLILSFSELTAVSPWNPSATV